MYKPQKGQSTRIEVRSHRLGAQPLPRVRGHARRRPQGHRGGLRAAPRGRGRRLGALRRERRALGIEPLPQNLGEAIAVMERSELVAETLGEHVFDFFLRNKRRSGRSTASRSPPSSATGCCRCSDRLTVGWSARRDPARSPTTPALGPYSTAIRRSAARAGGPVPVGWLRDEVLEHRSARSRVRTSRAPRTNADHPPAVPGEGVVALAVVDQGPSMPVELERVGLHDQPMAPVEQVRAAHRRRPTPGVPPSRPGTSSAIARSTDSNGLAARPSAWTPTRRQRVR